MRSDRPPSLATAATSARLRAQPRRETKPELALRSELRRLGLTYRLHRRVLPGLRRDVDIALMKSRVAVDVRGCFWHGCLLHGTQARNNHQWWSEKIESNRTRDRDTEARLAAAGWRVVVAWEHDDPIRIARRIEDLVRVRRGNPPRSNASGAT